MNSSTQNALNLPPLNQIGFVVTNLQQALELYEPLFGPFTIMDAADMEWIYRGKPETSSMKIGFGKSGDVEIELIEWVSGKTPHKEFLEAGREGMHHLRFAVDNIAEKVQEAQAYGYREIWFKQFAEGLAASYLERDGDPLLIEFFENKLG